MITLFSYDEIQEMHDNEIRRESRAEGRDEIKQLYGELMKRLMPLGRIDELIDASSDSSKLSNLAEEFGIPILPQ